MAWTNNRKWFRRSFSWKAWSLMMFQQGYIQSIAYLLGWLVLRDHQYGAFWLKIRVCVDNLDLHFLVLFCLEPMKHEHSSPLSCLVSDTDTILILHSIFWTLQVSTCLCSVSASVSVLHRLELINWHGGVVSLWSKIVSMLCNNFCSLCLHLLKTCISTSKNHFEKGKIMYIDNLQIAVRSYFNYLEKSINSSAFFENHWPLRFISLPQFFQWSRFKDRLIPRVWINLKWRVR